MAQVFSRIERPDPALVQRYRDVRMDQIVKALPATQLLDGAIKPLAHRTWRFAGPAITVSRADAHALGALMATGVAQPGDVIVIAAENARGYAWGGGLTLSADHVGCAGVVVDGDVIDAEEILQRDTPVFCRGTTLRRVTDDQPGSVNVPITCGGVRIDPGDLMIGTLDGVCAIPRTLVPDIIVSLEQESRRIDANIARLKATRSTIFALRGGRTMTAGRDVDWID